MKGSEVFAKVYAASMSSPQIAVAFTLIVSTLNAASPSESDLNFGLMGVDSILDATDKDFIRQKMTESRIDLKYFSTLSVT